MRKKIFTLGLLICSFSFLSAQKVSISDYPGRLFEEGKKMYADENYIACIERMEAYRRSTTNREMLRQADYYIAASAFAKNDPDAKAVIRNFLQEYPQSEYANRLHFMLASLFFLENDYQEAMIWFGESDMFLLSPSEQEDYSFRFGYCSLQTGNEKQALPFFTVLSGDSKKYREPATYYKGYIHYMWGDYGTALNDFQSLQNSSEFRTASGFYITQIEFINGQYDDVIFSGERLLKRADLSPYNRLETQRVVGESYYHKGDYYQATPYLSQYVLNAPDPVRSSYYMLGAVYFRQYEYENAVRNLTRVQTGEDLISQNTYLLLGQSYLQLNDKRNARLAFESASNMSFDREIQEVAMFNCGLLTHETGYSAFGESVLIFERFLNIFPDSEYTDQVNDCLVETFLTTRDYEAALTSIAKIKHPGNKILEAKQNILFQVGTQYFANNDFRTAIRYFDESLQVGNYNANTRALNYFWRGESYYRLDRYQQAVSDYETYLTNRAGTDKATYSSALYNLGYAYFKQKNYSSALANFNKYVSAENNASNPSYPDAYNRIGDCYFYSRNLAQAEASYAKAASVGGGSDYALFQRAFVSGLQKDYQGKINSLNKLIDQYPRSSYLPDAYFEKARAYVLLGQNSNALQTFGQLESRFPESSWSRKAGLQKGMLYFDSGDLDNAIAAYKKVVTDYPASEEARIAIQDLKTVYLDKNDVQGYVNYVNTIGGGVRIEVSEQDSLTYLAAEKLYMRGDNANARMALQNYLKSFPTGAFYIPANYYLASSYFAEKNYAEASRQFEVVANAPDNKFTEDALARIAEIAFTQKDYGKALDYFKRLNKKAESAENRQAAKIGMLRSAAFLDSSQEILNAADELLQDKKLSPELKNEALYNRAKANARLKNNSKAADDWVLLAEDTRNVYGAEAAYLVGQYYYDTSQYDKAEEQMLNFIRKGTPHSYWLARGFILLADVYIAKGDSQQAKQYLQSLQNNYNGTNDNIGTLIEERMKKIR
ncbi:MAG: tetratricopeptide repeat protein [Candidatus Azobacteroides sp.]|nr:tetratricopeptide repeat protein [Candidatus Azobacteroides sp.]